LIRKQIHKSAAKFVTARKYDMKADMFVGVAPASQDCMLTAVSRLTIQKTVLEVATLPVVCNRLQGCEVATFL